MAFDLELAERIRECLDPMGVVATEMKMFGGLAFLVGGNMAVAASGSGGLLVRVDPASSASLCDGGKASPMVMKGRPMTGWLQVPAANVRSARDLRRWVSIGVTYAQGLPAKATRVSRRRAGSAR